MGPWAQCRLPEIEAAQTEGKALAGGLDDPTDKG